MSQMSHVFHMPERSLINHLLNSDIDNSSKTINSYDIFLDSDLPFIKQIFSRESNIDIKCCVLSALIYETLYHNIVDYANSLHLKVHSVNTLLNNTKYGVFSSGGILYIVFKGSSNFDDFYTDVNIKLVSKPEFNGLVHNGFSSSILENKRSIYKNITPLLNSFDTILITGHSLGAALSIILFKLLSRDYPNKDIRNINFGSPKIGDSLFCSNTITRRIVNNKDIICRLPFTFLGYSHVDLGSLTKTKKYTLFPNLTDHRISEYFKTLKNSLIF